MTLQVMLTVLQTWQKHPSWCISTKRVVGVQYNYVLSLLFHVTVTSSTLTRQLPIAYLAGLIAM